MKVMRCPLNGDRNINEFQCAGEVAVMPDAADISDDVWRDYLWLSANEAGVVREWWCHLPTSYWFIAERNTVTDEIVRTYASEEMFNKRVEFVQPEPAKDPAA
jgi:sarcosine oxidase subunit delta